MTEKDQVLAPAEPKFPLAGRRVWVAGHRGMVGSALVRRLASEACDVLTAGRADLDLTRQTAVEDWIATSRPDVVVVAAAKVGGILANDRQPAEFLYENLMIEANIIHTAWIAGVKRLLFLGSSCISPRLAPQPIEESSLLTGPLEPTNEAYAVAKITGIKLVQAYRRQYGVDYISAMPTNLYGPGDNYDLQTSHVLPALLHKAHVAKIRREPRLTIWGTGTPRREFLHADDCADALVHVLTRYSASEHINIGSGKDLTIMELARLVCAVVGYTGDIVTDASKPDGTPRKLMCNRKLEALGWRPRIGLRDGIADAYRDFLTSIGEPAPSARRGRRK